MKDWKNDDTFLAKWLAGELSAEEKELFESSEEGKEFMAMINASTLIGTSPYDTENELSNLKKRINTPTEKRTKVFWMQPAFQLAAAASIAIIIATVYLFSGKDYKVMTGFSEQEIVQLPDGSEVRINAVSKLEYNASEWEKSRTVTLEGEGFFKVNPGEEFKVQTVAGSVTVLGTSFNVKNRGSLFEVQCFTGKVEVSSQHVTKQLTRGMTVKIDSGELIAFKQGDLNTSPSWMNGITELDSVTLAHVLDELNYVFGVTVTYDNTLNHMVYTGAFPNRSPEAAFKLVFEPLDIRYSYDSSAKRLTIHGLNP